MLSKRKEYQNEIYMACQKSGDVNINDRFKGVRFLGSVFFEKYYETTPCVCIGKIGSSERVFLTEDKLCYFSVTGGWGEKDGFLVALSQGFEFKHDKPMEIDDLKKLISNLPEAHGFASHMKRGIEIGTAKKLISILENVR